ncbi:hypothetical protein HQ571_04225 [Candidatus Kuenenbacteria bacterium]|nr:hypothetical protein [Candidatus Kuenenbacteria bacterium]
MAIINKLQFMREILSLSLPSLAEKNRLKNRAKQRGFQSLSDYVKFLILEDADLIPEHELWQEIQQGRKEYKKKRTIKAKSMRELL